MGTFTYMDLGESVSIATAQRKLKQVRKEQCPNAMLVLRQTYGTDFPPFFAIESKAYHNKCNQEGEFTLLNIFNN